MIELKNEDNNVHIDENIVNNLNINTNGNYRNNTFYDKEGKPAIKIDYTNENKKVIKE